MYFSSSALIPEKLIRMKRVMKKIIIPKTKASNQTLFKTDKLIVAFANGAYSFHEVTSHQNNSTMENQNLTVSGFQTIFSVACVLMAFLATVVITQYILAKIYKKTNGHMEKITTDIMNPSNTTDSSLDSLHRVLEGDFINNKSKVDLELLYGRSNPSCSETEESRNEKHVEQMVPLHYEYNHNSLQHA